MAASALKPSAGRHRGERACLSCLCRVGQGLFFLSTLPTTHPTYHCPKALAITSYSMAFQVPVVGTAAARWPSLSIAKGPINMLKASCT